MRIALILLTLTACAAPRVEPSPRPAPQAAPHAHVSAPARVTLESLSVSRVEGRSPDGLTGTGTPPASAGSWTEAQLVARVILNASADLPVAVTLSLPPGATLRSGRAQFTLPSLRAGTVVEERYTIVYAAAPAEPVVFRAHAAGEDFGFHAEAQWRFGRPEAPAVRVAADGTRLVLGRHDFGPSVRVHR
ncbi:MAG: hypothetical protein KA978_23790 [Deltaproteobacteria bacterium]|jgi:hypothetical protein|nr:hypothetical protein [Deltaproteobacteria bacterium]MBP6833829.1 hypothetical protein [Deltaproteobacteria bacterium]